MTESGWGGILQSENSKELAERLRKSLFERMSESGAAESLELLYRLRDELDLELTVGKRIPEELNKLIDEVHKSLDVAGLQDIALRFSPFVTELYKVRPSVGIVCALAGSFLDKLLTTMCEHAVCLLKSEGRVVPETPWALLTSGEMGREETILGRRSSFFFVYGEETESPGCSKELALKLRSLLTSCFPALNAAQGNPLVFFWSGSTSEWLALSSALLKGEKNDVTADYQRGYAQIFETLADLRTVGGDATFGHTVIDAGRKQLADSIHNELFWQLAKDIADMPVAVGLFGRFKTVKSGKNRGKFNLKELVLDPMTAAARILAITSGGAETSFNGRIKAILATGNIGVALADRLLIAYQDFMRDMIKLDLAAPQEGGALFFDPEQMNEEARERFKAGMEDVTTLQRLVHQQLVEVEQG